MALRMIHLLAVGAFSLTVYAYASYYAAPATPRVLHPSLRTPSSLVNTTLQTSEVWSSSHQTPLANSSSASPVSQTSQAAPTVITAANVTTPKIGRDLSQGIKTRSLYAAGHTVPLPEICPSLGSALKLLIVIMSAPAHLDARMAIRQTWGHYASRKDISLAFLLGSTEDQKLELALQGEGTLYSDIIRGRFYDSYDNLTLKTVSMMEWVSDYCPSARFVLKTDDDMFINIPKLLTFGDKHANEKKVIFGRLAKRWKPIRNPKSKYYVSTKQYRPPVFPDFTTGPAYMLSASLAGDLYKASLDMTYLKLEDVFTTGVVAQKLRLKRAHAGEFLNKRVPMNACTVQRAISIHMVKFSEQFDLWKKLLDGKAKCK